MTDALVYDDRVYGRFVLPEGVAHLIATPTFERLRRVNQAGASKYAHPERTVTRFEHSLGVYVLLRQLGASFQEQIAGLLHDISHTAFSHVIDIVYYSEEQDFHEGIRDHFLQQADLAAALEELGFAPADFSSDDPYTLLEQPLPALCADRIDYSLRDAVANQVISPAAAHRLVADLVVVDGRLAMQTPDLAREYQALFQSMNDVYWASQRENYLYETLAQILEMGLASNVISQADLLTDDATVEAKLRAAGDSRIDALFTKLVDPPAEAEKFVGRRPIKQRSIDPPVLVDGVAVPLSTLVV